MKRRSFRLGECEIAPASNAVAGPGGRSQVEPRAMDVLVFLCGRPNEVVSVEELLLECWGSALHGDNPVHKVVTQLRRVLGDSSAAPRYIETIRKRGYRVVAPVVYDDDAAPDSWMQGSPFRGLEPFEERHAGIFFGRRRALDLLIATLPAQVDAGCALVLVLGPSGSGKTSLIRAGLLPRLLAGTPAAVAIDYHLFLDCGDGAQLDLFQALGSVLLDCEDGSEAVFVTDSAATLGQRLQHDMPGVVAQLKMRAPATSLCLVVDRLEAIFRLAHQDQASRAAFIGALNALACSGQVLLVLACRNDFYPHLMDFPELVAAKLRGGHVDLAAPDAADIAQMIRQPARAAALTFEIDPVSGASLDDVLCDAARGSPDILPLLQYCLDELYRGRGEGALLRHAVLRDLGGIEGAIGARAEQLVATLDASEIAALPKVLSHLVSLAEDEHAVTARRVPWGALQSDAEHRLVQALVNARLCVSGLLGDVPTFGVAHEAILRRWPRVVDWIEQHRQALQLRARVGLQARRWHDNNRPRDLLLPRGSQARQARSLLENGALTLSPLERTYIGASLRGVTLSERARMGVFALVLALAVVASALGLVARNAQQKAEQHRTEAEGLMGYMLGEFVDKLRPIGRLDLLDGISSRSLGYLSVADASQLGPVALMQRSKALQLLAEVRIARGDPVAAKSALQAARELALLRLRAEPGDLEAMRNLAANAFWLGQLYLDESDWPQAQQHFGEYLRISDNVAAARPDDIEALVEQSYAHNSLGTLALQRSDVGRAAREFAVSVEQKTRALARKPGDANLTADLADSLSWLANTREKLGQLEEAMQLYRRGTELVRPLQEAGTSDALWSFRLALSIWHQAELKMALGENRQALGDFVRARQLLQAIVKMDPSNRDWQADLAKTEIKILELDTVRADSVVAGLEAQYRTLGTLAALEPKKLALRRLMATTQERRAGVHLAAGRPAEARRHLQDALDALETLHAGAPTDTQIRQSLVDALLLRADLERSAGNAAPALQACRRVQTLLRQDAAGSADFHVLAPWVRAHYCTCEAAQVQAQQEKLHKMAYAEAGYMRQISSTPLKGTP